MFEDFNILDSMLRGGLVMAVLLAFSVASLAVIIGKFSAFSAFRKGLFAELGAIKSALDSNGLKGGLDHAKANKGPLSSIFLAGLKSRKGGKSDILSSMEPRAKVVVTALERYLGVLGSVGSTAPFVGLLGTVIGIVKAFRELTVEGGVGAVTGGIAEALVATAAGLIVAIPAVIAYNYFVRAVKRLAVDLEAAAHELADEITRAAAKGEGTGRE